MADWRELLDASLKATSSEPSSRFFQLATTDASGLPQNRTVVCREFDSNSETLWFVTDTRSDKYASLQHREAVAVCWYFIDTREQFRITASAQCFDSKTHTSLIDKYWSRLSEAAREQFFWGQPGAKRPEPDVPLEFTEHKRQAPEHFCVVGLTITGVDYLNLSVNPQQRVQFSKRSGDWISESVIP